MSLHDQTSLPYTDGMVGYVHNIRARFGGPPIGVEY